MSDKILAERMLFTFRHNGRHHEQDLVEITAEKLAEHEPPAGASAEEQSWFGPEEKLGSLLEELGFSALDLEGIIATLRVNKIATRELQTAPEALGKVGFAPVAGS